MMSEQVFPGRGDQYSNDNEREQSSERDEAAVPGSVSIDEDDMTEEELVADTEEEEEDPILTEEDLEENDLTEEEADDIEWEEPQR